MDKELRMLEARTLRADGLKQREIADQLGVSDRTIRTWLKNPPRPRKKPIRISKLDPFKDFINSIIKEEPYYNCEVLLDRLFSMGYTGKISILRDYVAVIRKEIITQAVIRFETEPGYQAQVDWGEFRRTRPDGSKEKLYAFKMTLGFSRRSFVIYTRSMTQDILFACHILAFIYFGCVPKEILYDNMKTAFIRDSDGVWRAHKNLLSFANHYGFIPRRCRVRRPETKGKVERAIGFLRSNFWPRVKDTVWDLDELNQAVITWLKSVDQKKLRDFNQTRLERFETEMPYMRCLPDHHFDYRKFEPVMVSRESYIIFETNRYSVPAEYIGKQLDLRVDRMNGTGEILDGNHSIRHIVLYKKGEKLKNTRPEDRESVKELWLKQRQRKRKAKMTVKKSENDVSVRNPAEYDRLLAEEVA